MLAYKHKVSGKYFVFVEELDNGGVKFINPEGRPWYSNYNDYSDDPEEGNEDTFLERGLITKDQAEKYETLNLFIQEEQRDKELLKKIDIKFGKIPSDYKFEFLFFIKEILNETENTENYESSK